MEINMEEIEKKLKKYDQEHLLRFYNTFDEKNSNITKISQKNSPKLEKKKSKKNIFKRRVIFEEEYIIDSNGNQRFLCVKRINDDDEKKHKGKKKKNKESDEEDEEEDEEEEDEEEEDEDEENEGKDGGFDFKQNAMKFAEDDVQDALRISLFNKKKAIKK